jgi:hypothetical protein
MRIIFKIAAETTATTAFIYFFGFLFLTVATQKTDRKKGTTINNNISFQLRKN